MNCPDGYIALNINPGTGLKACVKNGMVYTPNGDIPISDYILSQQGGASNSNSNNGNGWFQLDGAADVIDSIGGFIGVLKGRDPADDITNNYYQTLPETKSATPGWVWALVAFMGVVVLAMAFKSRTKKLAA